MPSSGGYVPRFAAKRALFVALARPRGTLIFCFFDQFDWPASQSDFFAVPRRYGKAEYHIVTAIISWYDFD